MHTYTIFKINENVYNSKILPIAYKKLLLYLFKNIILIPRQPVFVLTPYCCLLNGEAANTNLIVFNFTRPGLKLMIYHTRGEYANHYTTDAIQVENEGWWV